MAKKLLKSRRGISPILATLLLIVIAVAAVVVTYAWLMTYMSSQTGKAEVSLYKANVNFIDGSTKKIKVDIGNSGDSDTNIVKIYLGTDKGSLTEQTNLSPSLPVSLAANSIVSITITYNWHTSTTYYFKIISSSGQTLEFQEQAPTS